MRKLILIFLVVIASGGAVGASASGGATSVESHPPVLPSDVTCTTANEATTCFYPAHRR
jgi:hypothetical protein